MRRLWTEERVTHRGRFYRFEEIGFEPKPARVPVPILIGGDTPAALKRAARSGDGWFGLRYTPESAAARIRELRAMRAGDQPFEITISPETVPDVDDIRRFRDAGRDRLVLVAKALGGRQKNRGGYARGPRPLRRNGHVPRRDDDVPGVADAATGQRLSGRPANIRIRSSSILIFSRRASAPRISPSSAMLAAIENLP